MSSGPEDPKNEWDAIDPMDETGVLKAFESSLDTISLAPSTRRTLRPYQRMRTTSVNDFIQSMKPFIHGNLPPDIDFDLRLSYDPLSIRAEPSRLASVIKRMVQAICRDNPLPGTLVVQTRKSVPDRLESRGRWVGEDRALAVIEMGFRSGIEIGGVERIGSILEPGERVWKIWEEDSSVADALKAMGGYALINDNPRHKFNVKVLIPTVESRRKRPTGGFARYREDNVGGQTILVVDHDIGMLRRLNRTLEWLDYRVFLARDAEEAVRIFVENQESMDLVLLELNMPDKHGCQIMLEIQQIKLTTHFILTTAKDLDSESRKFVQNRYIPVIRKPYSMENLVGIVECVIEQAALHDI